MDLVHFPEFDWSVRYRLGEAYPFDLGAYSWPVSTKAAQAQIWFDRGLNWLYGFNHEEAVTCFRKAARHDPNFGMAWWGVAYASGPFYNMPWRFFTAAEAKEATAICYAAAQTALGCLDGATDVEVALIQAIAVRYPKDHPVDFDEFDWWDINYADAMRAVYTQFPENPDVTALCAEALMVLTPWKLWDVHTGKVARGAATLEVLDMLQRAISAAEIQEKPQHPAILHMHIHVLEMSDTPEDALISADRLLGLCPDAGHLQHMPGHIYVLCGKFYQTLTSSREAIVADRKYLDFRGPYNFYTTARCHDLHLMMYAAMMAGCFQDAMQGAEEIRAALTPVVLKTDKNHMAITLEGYFATQMHVLVRFGKWQQIIDTPMPSDPALYVVSTAMHHYARGVAYANLKQFELALAEQENFRRALAELPPERMYFNNRAADILAVGREMLSGELAYHRGNHDLAFACLRHAADLDDHLFYTEPWAWMHPPRHALGALLLAQGHVSEAEAVYRADLGYDRTLPRCCRHPENVWALHGLAECLTRLGREPENILVQQRLAFAMARADTKITASCCCRAPGAVTQA